MSKFLYVTMVTQSFSLSVKNTISIAGMLFISSIIIHPSLAEAKYTPPDNQPAPQGSGDYGGTSLEQRESTVR